MLHLDSVVSLDVDTKGSQQLSKLYLQVAVVLADLYGCC